MSKRIRAVVVRHGQAPSDEVIEESLEGLRAIVGGHIDIVHIPSDDPRRRYALVCDDEGRLKGKPRNLTGIAGDFLICRSEPPDLGSMDDVDVRSAQDWLFQNGLRNLWD